MRGLPSDLDLDFLLGQELTQICFGPVEVVLNFSPDLSLSLNCLVSLNESPPEEASKELATFRALVGNPLPVSTYLKVAHCLYDLALLLCCLWIRKNTMSPTFLCRAPTTSLYNPARRTLVLTPHTHGAFLKNGKYYKKSRTCKVGTQPSLKEFLDEICGVSLLHREVAI